MFSMIVALLLRIYRSFTNFHSFHRITHTFTCMSFDTNKAFWFTHVASHNAKHRAFVYGSISLFNVTTLLTFELSVFPLLEVWRITHSMENNP